MIEFLTEYGMFLAKLSTVVALIMLVIGALFFMVMRSRSAMNEHLDIKNINQKYEQLQLMLRFAIFSKKEFKKAVKEIKSKHKKGGKKQGQATDRRRVFILNFKGDIRASEVHSLREEITALLTVAGKRDEVLVKVESSGGTVHGYGLAASQLKRVRNKNITLTVSVDKVAASGGYMMACVADKIIAAPFAIIGSIGVLAQLPNFNRFLKKHGIEFEQISAGRHKRTLTLFGENTDEDREKLKDELEETHDLFKHFVKENREIVDVEKIATGEHWYGKQALELKLVDQLLTSDDYLCTASENADLYELEYVRKKPFLEKIFSSTVKMFNADRYG